LERAGYEARLAERSYRAADPDNRMVVRTLERRWEEALRREQEVREGYVRRATSMSGGWAAGGISPVDFDG
jgi:hypothetical protein